ncbi:MAG: peptide deformylase [Candidatus Omnitrophota bacterium]
MKKTELKINIFGSPALRKKAKPIKKITQEHKEALSQMARLMYEFSGVGLAAAQVGLEDAMLVADIGTGLYKLINPVIIRKEGTQVLEEGCLSVPGVCIKVRRSLKVWIKALNENAEPLDFEAEGLLACVFQHEMDHLKGRLIVDYASFFEKFKITKELKELKKRAEDEKLSQSETKSCSLQL